MWRPCWVEGRQVFLRFLCTPRGGCNIRVASRRGLVGQSSPFPIQRQRKLTQSYPHAILITKLSWGPFDKIREKVRFRSDIPLLLGEEKLGQQWWSVWHFQVQSSVLEALTRPSLLSALPVKCHLERDKPYMVVTLYQPAFYLYPTKLSFSRKLINLLLMTSLSDEKAG